MDRHDRLHRRPERRGDGGGVHAQRIPVDVGEYRRRPRLADGVGRTGKGERRYDDLVAAPDPRRSNAEVERHRSAGDRNGVLHANVCRECGLEPADGRTLGEGAGPQHRIYGQPFFEPDHRSGQGDHAGPSPAAVRNVTGPRLAGSTKPPGASSSLTPDRPTQPTWRAGTPATSAWKQRFPSPPHRRRPWPKHQSERERR